MNHINTVIAANEELQEALESMKLQIPVRLGSVSVALEEAMQDDSAQKKTTLIEKIKALFNRLKEWFFNLIGKNGTKEKTQEGVQKFSDVKEKAEAAFDKAMDDLKSSFESAAAADADTAAAFTENNVDIGDEIIRTIASSKTFEQTVRKAIEAEPKIGMYVFMKGNVNYTDYASSVMAIEKKILDLITRIKQAASNVNQDGDVSAIAAIGQEIEPLKEREEFVSHTKKLFANKNIHTQIDYKRFLTEVNKLTMQRPKVMFAEEGERFVDEFVDFLNKINYDNMTPEKARDVISTIQPIVGNIMSSLGWVHSVVNTANSVHMSYINAFNKIAAQDDIAKEFETIFSKKYPNIKGMRETVMFSIGAAHLRCMDGRIS